MGQRLDLHNILVGILGSTFVYFQPPSNIKINYPCIVYKRDRRQVTFANNKKYKELKRYQVTVIDRNPDSEIPDKISNLPYCSFERFFTTDNLNHDVYNIYF